MLAIVRQDKKDRSRAPITGILIPKVLLGKPG